MRRYLIFLLLIIVFIPAAAHALVRLKNVTQSGRGDTGAINMEFTAGYDTSNIKIEYYADHVALILRDAYTTPPSKRVFKSSSPKSSVIRMEASMVPISKKNSATVKLDIYFRIPVDIIKKTGDLISKGNFVRYNYRVTAPLAVAAVEAVEDHGGEVQISDNEIGITGAEPREPQTLGAETVRTEKIFRASTVLFGVLKVMGVLIALVAFFYLAAFFFRKYTQKKPGIYTPSYTPFAPSVEPPVQDVKQDIKIISYSELEDGKKLYVIDVAGEKLLIGSSRESLSMLAKLAKSGNATMMTEEQETAMKSRLREKLRNL